MKITELTVHELNDKLKNKEITREEIVKAYIDRIKEKENDVQAFITITDKEKVIEQARKVEEEVRNGNITNELVSKLGMKNLSKGVKVIVSPEDVKVDLSIELKYGYSVMVQEKVKQAIETMTGLTVSMVRVRIAGVAIDKEGKASKA